MKTCGSPLDLARSEGDGWFAAPGIVVWRIEGVDGASLWGRVTNAQIEVAFAVAHAYLGDATGRPLDVVSDLTAVTSFDDAIYLRLATHLAALGPRISSRVRSHVGVVPDGVLRAATVGMLHLHTMHRWRIDADLRAAVGEPIAATVSALVDPRRDHDLVTALRAHVTSDSLIEAARSLGVAPRTLQRALRGAGTSFRAIVEEQRLAAACRLLDESDLKVEAIAHEVGFGSLSGFVRSFRRVNGCSPHERRLSRGA